MRMTGIFKKRERGQILVPVLVMLAVGALLVPTLIGFMGTGLKAVRTYQGRTERVYAADTGINAAIFKIVNGEVPKNVDYKSPPFTIANVNNSNVQYTISSVWILSGIVDPIIGPHNPWVDVQDVHASGNPSADGVYTMVMTYTGNAGNKKIEQMGVLLPNGFEYEPGSASDPAYARQYPGDPEGNIELKEPDEVVKIRGGYQSIKWTKVNYSFKNLGDVAKQRFRFNPVGQLPKGDVAWVGSLSHDIGVIWDQMIWTYAITSIATSNGKTATVEAHVSWDTGDTANIAILTYALDQPGP